MLRDKEIKIEKKNVYILYYFPFYILLFLAFVTNFCIQIGRCRIENKISKIQVQPEFKNI